MLHFRNLSKVFRGNEDRKAIDSVTFDVLDGEVVGFVGLNGAGKTTTIRIASGVALPTSGGVLVDGHDIVHDKLEASRQIGWVPEFPNFDMGERALNLMEYFCGFYRLDTLEAKRRSTYLLERVGLDRVAEKKLRTFSQGMKKRFSLASAMISDPRNYLFDETLNGLDPEGVQFVRNLIVSLRKANKAVLLSSHILTEVENLADRIVLIHNGKIVREIKREELGRSSLEQLFFATIKEAA
ncbi:MAG: ABC transporter ATP-binding protein [Nitrososphaerales archaeon]